MIGEFLQRLIGGFFPFDNENRSSRVGMDFIEVVEGIFTGRILVAFEFPLRGSIFEVAIAEWRGDFLPLFVLEAKDVEEGLSLLIAVGVAHGFCVVMVEFAELLEGGCGDFWSGLEGDPVGLSRSGFCVGERGLDFGGKGEEVLCPLFGFLFCEAIFLGDEGEQAASFLLFKVVVLACFGTAVGDGEGGFASKAVGVGVFLCGTVGEECVEEGVDVLEEEGVEVGAFFFKGLVSCGLGLDVVEVFLFEGELF